MVGNTAGWYYDAQTCQPVMPLTVAFHHVRGPKVVSWRDADASVVGVTTERCQMLLTLAENQAKAAPLTVGSVGIGVLFGLLVGLIIGSMLPRLQGSRGRAWRVGAWFA